MIDKLIKNSISKGLTYREYVELVNDLAKQGGTTGSEQSKLHIDFTKLNASRMRRLDKTIVISEEAMGVFKDIPERQTWLVLLESWCSDGTQTIPILNKIAEDAPNIDLRIVLRDENDSLMAFFLTNGTKSIPKLIMVDAEGKVLNTWGPRSKTASKMVADYKDKNGNIDDSFKEALQIWYNKDRGKEIINDLMEIVKYNNLDKMEARVNH